MKVTDPDKKIMIRTAEADSEWPISLFFFCGFVVYGLYSLGQKMIR